MSKQELQFIVVGVIDGEHFTVIGRCGGTPIHVGDVFDAVYRYQRRRSPDELGREPVREVDKPASIRVLCIHAYERSLEMLGQGVTGSLTIAGEGLQFIAPGWILGQSSQDAAVESRESHPSSVSS